MYPADESGGTHSFLISHVDMSTANPSWDIVRFPSGYIMSAALRKFYILYFGRAHASCGLIPSSLFSQTGRHLPDVLTL